MSSKNPLSSTFAKGLDKAKRKKQRAPQEVKTTLNAKHKEIVKTIEENNQLLPTIKNDLQTAQTELAQLRQGDYSTFTHTEFTQINKLEQKIVQLERKITLHQRSAPSSVTDYLLQNGEIINEYFDLDTNNNQTVKKVSASEIFKKGRITLNDPMGQHSSKMNCLRKFLSNVDPDFSYVGNNQVNEENFCDDCGKFRVSKTTEAKMVCPECGSEISVIMESDKPSMKDPPPDSRHYEYKRFHHFCDWLAKIQGKESTDVPDSVIDAIEAEIKRERIKNRKTLDEPTIRRFLKKYPKSGFDKYFNHITQILFKINGIPPLTLTHEQEREYKQMFLMIQEPYERHRPDTRSNFLSYSYIIYKCSQLLGYDHVAERMNLLKSKDKLYQLDQIWRKILKELGGREKGWVFIASRKV